jgi:hypothetical protein
VLPKLGYGGLGNLPYRESGGSLEGDGSRRSPKKQTNRNWRGSLISVDKMKFVSASPRRYMMKCYDRGRLIRLTGMECV